MLDGMEDTTCLYDVVADEVDDSDEMEDGVCESCVCSVTDGLAELRSGVVEGASEEDAVGGIATFATEDLTCEVNFGAFSGTGERV